MILVVLPVFSEANLNTQSQSDVSQSRWIYWIYRECSEWLDYPVDTLLPGNIMGNALQSLCTSLVTHGLLPRVQEWNITTGKHRQVPSFCMERARTSLDTILEWAQCTNTELQGQEAARKWAQGSQTILWDSRSYPEHLLPAHYPCMVKKKVRRHLGIPRKKGKCR